MGQFLGADGVGHGVGLPFDLVVAFGEQVAGSASQFGLDERVLVAVSQEDRGVAVGFVGFGIDGGVQRQVGGQADQAALGVLGRLKWNLMLSKEIKMGIF